MSTVGIARLRKRMRDTDLPEQIERWRGEIARLDQLLIRSDQLRLDTVDLGRKIGNLSRSADEILARLR